MTEYVWHDDNYNKRIKITVDSTNIISDVHKATESFGGAFTYTDDTFRYIIPGHRINYNATTIQIKLTQYGATSFQIEEMWVGHTDGGAYSFDGNQVQVTFDGGNTASERVTSYIWTDPINVNVTANRPFMCSFYFGSTYGSVARSSTAKDYFWYSKSTTNEAADTNPTGFTLGSPYQSFVDTISVISGSNTLSNFPLAICLSNEAGIYNDDVTDVFTTISGNSTNLAVYTTSGTQDVQCYIEVDYWDYENQKAILWTCIPELETSTDSILYLYYGSDSPNTSYVGTTGSYPAKQVWDNNYVGVWHMSQDPSGAAPQLLNSTYNDNDGTSYGDMSSEDLVASGVGGSWVFDGSDDAVYINPDDSLDIVESITLEWYGSFTTMTCPSTHQVLIGKAYNGDSYTNASYYLGVYRTSTYDRIFLQFMGPGGFYYNTPGPIYVDNIYRYIAGSYSDSHWVLRYNDLELGSSKTYTGNITPNINTPLTLSMTYWGDSFSANPFLGISSEFRLSKTVRTTSWLSACYYVLTDTLLSYDIVEEKPSFIFYGYVTTNDVPSDNTVYLYRRSTGELVGTTVSDPVTGYFEINSAYSDDHFVIILPELEDTNLLSYDRLNPGS